MLGCAWYGTARFCNGKCPKSKKIQDHESSWYEAVPQRGFGKSCWTGQKVLCCEGMVY